MEWSDPVIIALISAVASTIAAILACIVALAQIFYGRKVENVRKDVAEIKRNTNGMTEQLVEQTGKLKFEEGKKVGAANEKLRNGSSDFGTLAK